MSDITPSTAKVCYETAIADTYELAITYPIGTGSSFSLIGAPTWLGINATTGAISFDNSDITEDAIGVWSFIIKYQIGVGDYSFAYFSLVIEKCLQLNTTSVNFCLNDATKTFQLGVEGATADTFSMAESIPGISISSDGVITYDKYLYLDTDITVSYKVGDDTYTEVVHLYANNCLTDGVENIDMCEEDVVNIVWRNANGGNESYTFIKEKNHSTSQKGDTTFINSDRELRFSTRDNINGVTEVLNEYVPKSHITKISRLRDSIQAWIATDVNNPATYKPIIIEPGDFNMFEAGAQYFTLNFKYRLAKSKLIQRQ